MINQMLDDALRLAASHVICLKHLDWLLVTVELKYGFQLH
jgi:hypothetical protein